MDNKELVSIIVPVFNADRYLAECLDSMLSQTYTNLDIVLVDDGSTDASAELCDSYARKDKRITVIHKKNGGVSDARNVALDMVKGDYITFVDADDILSADAVSLLLTTALEFNADISAARVMKFVDTPPVLKPKQDNKTVVFSSKEALAAMYYRKIPGYACGKLFSRIIAQGIRFPVGISFGEDTHWVSYAMKKASRIAISDGTVYYYRQVSTSAVHKGFTSSSMTLLDSTDLLYEAFSDEGEEIKKGIISKEFYVSVDLLGRVYGLKEYAAEKKRIVDKINSCKKTILLDKENTIFVRMMALVAMLSTELLGFVSSRRNL